MILHVGAGSARSQSEAHPLERVWRSSNRARTRRVLATLVLTLLTLAAASAAGHAGTINVWACHQPDGQTVAPIDHWTSSITASGIHTSNSCASGGAGYLYISVDAVAHPGHSNGTWKFTAPAGTSVTGFSYLRSAATFNWADATAFRSDLGLYDGPNIAETCGPPGNCSW